MGLLEWLAMEGAHPGTEGAAEEEALKSDYKFFSNHQLTHAVHVLDRLQAA